MTSLSLKIEKFAVYIIIIYMATMTGLYFHMDSRINVLQTMQNKTFEKYALKEQKHDEDIANITKQVSELSQNVKGSENNITEHLNSLSNMLLNDYKKYKPEPKTKK